MQKILFPMKFLNITTGVNMLSHIGTLAIDNAGENTSIDNVIAPFTGIIKRKWPNGNTVWLESVEPVEFADGTVDYAVFEVTHDNNINDLYVGQRIEQGQIFYQEGTAGNANGNHVHMELGKGRFSGTGWYQNPQGVWTVNNGYAPWNAYFLPADTVIKQSLGYAWKWLPEGEEMNKPDRAGVLGQFAAFITTAPTEQQIEYYTARPWSVLNEDLLVWNRDRRVELQSTVGAYEARVKKLIGDDEVEDAEYETIIKNKDVIIGERNEEISQLTQKINDLSNQAPTDDNRTFGELLSAAFKKLFSVK